MAKKAEKENLLAALVAETPAERVTAPVEGTAEAAARLAGLLEERAVAARFATLGASWDGNIPGLLRLAAARLHALNDQRKTEKASASEAKVPAALVQEALTVRARLRALLEYWLADDPTEGPELADLRTGTGYEDLASDLVRYAAMRERHEGLVRGDRKHYRAADAKEASRIAQELRAALAEGTSESAVSTELRRTFTAVRRLHGKAIAAAQFLYFGEPAADRFVTLAADLRRGAPPKKKPKPATPGG